MVFFIPSRGVAEDVAEDSGAAHPDRQTDPHPPPGWWCSGCWPPMVMSPPAPIPFSRYSGSRPTRQLADRSDRGGAGELPGHRQAAASKAQRHRALHRALAPTFPAGAMVFFIPSRGVAEDVAEDSGAAHPDRQTDPHPPPGWWCSGCWPPMVMSPPAPIPFSRYSGSRPTRQLADRSDRGGAGELPGHRQAAASKAQRHRALHRALAPTFPAGAMVFFIPSRGVAEDVAEDSGAAHPDRQTDPHPPPGWWCSGCWPPMVMSPPAPIPFSRYSGSRPTRQLADRSDRGGAGELPGHRQAAASKAQRHRALHRALAPTFPAGAMVFFIPSRGVAEDVAEDSGAAHPDRQTDPHPPPGWWCSGCWPPMVMSPPAPIPFSRYSGSRPTRQLADRSDRGGAGELPGHRQAAASKAQRHRALHRALAPTFPAGAMVFFIPSRGVAEDVAEDSGAAHPDRQTDPHPPPGWWCSGCWPPMVMSPPAPIPFSRYSGSRPTRQLADRSDRGGAGELPGHRQAAASKAQRHRALHRALAPTFPAGAMVFFIPSRGVAEDVAEDSGAAHKGKQGDC